MAVEDAAAAPDTTVKRVQLNVLVDPELVDEMADAIHMGAVMDGPADQAALVSSAVRRELDRLAEELNAGRPWSAERGARIRAARHRRRS